MKTAVIGFPRIGALRNYTKALSGVEFVGA